MKIVPLAFDSFSTRSMATFVETKDCKILIDPGISIAPSRYRLFPHPIELKKLEEDWKKIKKYAKECDIFILTHYHYDHFNLSEPEVWKKKIAFIKHPTENINLSQKGRAAEFVPKIKDVVEKLEFSDGRKFEFGGTEIEFSKPVFHGTNKLLGYVTEVCIREGHSSFVFSSDVEGPAVKDQAEFIINSKPNIAIIDAPMTYMLGFRYSYESLNASIKNLKRIIEETPLKVLILDHHFMRDLKYKERLPEVFSFGEKKRVNVISAAEYISEKIVMLEANRNKLFKEHPIKEIPKIKFSEE